MNMQKWGRNNLIQMFFITTFAFVVLSVPIFADGNTTKKYNETEMEHSQFITLQEFDEWLNVNDHYELESLQSVGSEMTYDDILEKCTPK